jgi:transcriptional regulator with XRE-family HTH domain
MNVGAALREARLRAGLSQVELAELTGTSQATLSSYENGRKLPGTRTFERLLAATGSRLVVEPVPPPAVRPSPAELRRRGRTLAEVIGLAEALPTRHEPDLRYPRLSSVAA